MIMGLFCEDKFLKWRDYICQMHLDKKKCEDLASFNFEDSQALLAEELEKVAE